jgi:hypothetical protein
MSVPATKKGGGSQPPVAVTTRGATPSPQAHGQKVKEAYAEPGR